MAFNARFKCVYIWLFFMGRLLYFQYASVMKLIPHSWDRMGSFLTTFLGTMYLIGHGEYLRLLSKATLIFWMYSRGNKSM
ncbi:hypothetical protein V8F33_003994 [Rhypophila sp. PSN 637]